MYKKYYTLLYILPFHIESHITEIKRNLFILKKYKKEDKYIVSKL